MAKVELSLEGFEADQAAESLFQSTGIQGSWEISGDSSSTKEGTLAVIGIIVGIVGGAVAVAEQIRQWYIEAKKSRKRFNVVLVSDDLRIALEDATIEDICSVLETLES